jgi:glycosyltransferase involved in cell wall biosynthesis
MNILYDHQMFAIQRFGGISRIFIELMQALSSEPDCALHWFRGIQTDGYDISSFQAQLKRYAAIQTWPFGLEKRYPKTVNRLAFQSFNTLLGQPYDIYHPTYYDATWLTQVRSRRLVVTICDMIPELFLTGENKFQSLIQGKRELTQKADLVLAISSSTKCDLVNLLGVPPEKVQITYLASSMGETIAAPLPALAQQKPYFLYVGTRSRYKNFDILMQAFAQSQWLQQTAQVICFGGSSDFLAPEQQFFATHGLSDHFHYLTGDDRLLKALYQKAQALVYTSRYEGFGLPPLEAMECGTPVICGHNSSLPEVVGEAATFFDTDSAESLAVAMQQIMVDTSYRAEKIKLGCDRTSLFSWQKTAHQTHQGYRSLF